jgi:hypothetical protein
MEEQIMRLEEIALELLKKYANEKEQIIFEHSKDFDKDLENLEKEKGYYHKKINWAKGETKNGISSK